MGLTLGFIGAGTINRVHMASARRLGLTLGGVADPCEAARRSARAAFGLARDCADYRQLLADPGIDAVVVGTPNFLHAEQAMAALEAGKHVLLEKPMARDLAEARRIVSAWRASGKVLQVGMINRFRQSTQALRAVVESGRCGRIYAGQTAWYRRRGVPGFGGWFTTRARSGGGCLIDLGVHMIDLALYLWGFPRPVAVSGMTYNVWRELDRYTYTDMWSAPTPGGKKDVEDYAVALIRFDHGQTLQVNIAWALNTEDMKPDTLVRLMGEKGGVALHGFDTPRLYGEEAGQLIDTHPQVAACDPDVEQLRHFAECVRGGRQPLATPEQALLVQSLLEAIYRSSEEGREIRLDEAQGLSQPAAGSGQQRISSGSWLLAPGSSCRSGSGQRAGAEAQGLRTGTGRARAWDDAARPVAAAPAGAEGASAGANSLQARDDDASADASADASDDGVAMEA